MGGIRVTKSDQRISAIGDVDELNAALGLCCTATAEVQFREMLQVVQSRLFDLGAELALAQDSGREVGCIDSADIEWFEQGIDGMEAELEPLRRFVLPGGCELAARLHVARTICRRSERSVVALAQSGEISPAILTYLNRLSDWLFVCARFANSRTGVDDIPWEPRESKKT